MKMLLYQWDAYSERGLLKALKEMFHEVILYSRKIKNHVYDEEFLKELAVLLVQEKIEAVISFDYFPLISMACKAAHIKYISWVFGTPHYSLYSDTVFYEGNYIFCFEYSQYKELDKRGVRHAYHLPLAVDIELFQKSINCAEEREINDITFVGTMYTDARYYFEQISDLPEYVRGYIDGICESQLKLVGCDILENVLTNDFVKKLGKYINFRMDANYSLTKEQFIKDVIRKKITVMERSRTLGTLSEFFDVTVYTNSDTSNLPKLHNGGYVHYYDEMPQVFHKCKINLNITMRSILTGIPLRVLDVLGCGGFLITNYQEEIAECFEDGKDLVMYTSLEDLVEKCEYYLQHEEERIEIARNGYEKVKRQFSYIKQLTYIFEIVNKNGGQLKTWPIEIAEFSNEKKVQWSREYFGHIEQLYKKIEPEYKYYERKLNELVIQKASIAQIGKLLLEDSCIKLCDNYTNCSMWLVLGQIAALEQSLGIKHIYSQVSDLREAEELYVRISFGLRRAEHGWTDGWEEFVELLQRYQITHIALGVLLCQNEIVNKVSAIVNIVYVLCCYDRKQQAVLLLQYMEKRIPYNDRMIMEFAQCYLDMGELKFAYDILMKYDEPNQEIKELQQMLKENILNG